MSDFKSVEEYVRFLEGCGRSWGKNASFEAGHEQGYAEGYKDGMSKGLELLVERSRLAPQVPYVTMRRVNPKRLEKRLDWEEYKKQSQKVLDNWKAVFEVETK